MISRSTFVRNAGILAAGFSLAFTLRRPAIAEADDAAVAFAPNAWLRIASDDSITVVVAKAEMGQGVVLGLPTIIAEELDADMSRVVIEFAPADVRYIDPAYGDMITGGSTSVSDLWMPLRTAGATARAMLVTAAAKRWNVDPTECTTSRGVVSHPPSNRSGSYGSFAASAAVLPIPSDVPLKVPTQFTLIGRPSRRPDVPLKVNGAARFGIDVQIPGMRYAAISRSPVFGGSVKRFSATKALAVPGVLNVIQISNGVAVIAKNTWAAFRGKSALEIEWNDGPNSRVSTASLFADAEHLATTHKFEHVAVTRGNPLKRGEHVLEATYRGPLLAHATMEPMNATASVTADGCEVWAPNQVPLRAKGIAAKMSGLPPDKCTIHSTYLGGGFGRRLEADYVGEAVEVSRAARVPVKVTWTREDDIQQDFYRPMSLNVVRGAVAHGSITVLTHQVVSASWLRRWLPPAFKNGVDFLDLTEVEDAPYGIANFRVTYIDHEAGIPVGSWRAPDANWNGFVTESFMDELAHAAGEDPLNFRLQHLAKAPRAAAVLRVAAEKANWGTQRHGLAQGLALTFWAGSYAAMVADVSINAGMPKVHRVVAAVDCGMVINPDIVVQQAQGATNFGLAAALTGKITIRKGRVEQNNFYDYPVLRMADAPAIDVHVVPSQEKPTGIGEICTPPIGPAVGNAIFRLTGKRIRQLPFADAFAATSA